MELFALDADVAQLEAALPPLRGAARLAALVPLAWHLRQRDTARADALAAEAGALLAGLGPEPGQQGAVQLAAARLDLVRGEARWLFGELDAADALARAALAQLGALDDAAGGADARCLLASIAVDRGDHARADADLGLAAAEARRGGDQARLVVAESGLARWTVLHDQRAAAARWGRHFRALAAHCPTVQAACVHDFLGLAAGQSNDFGVAVGHFARSYEAALASGQLRLAMTAATNIGEGFSKLNDHHAALGWMQSALDLARQTGWPRSVGVSLMYTADTMRRLGRLDAAEELLREALAALAPLANARSYANALQFLGDLELDKGEHAAALDTFARLEQRGDALGQAEFQTVARRGQAHALAHLGRPREALLAAEQALELAARQGHAHHHIAALRVLASLHGRHPLPGPAGMAAPSAALHYLQRALAVAAGIDGYTLPGDLLDAQAREYAGAGDFARAYDSALAASAAREKTHSQEATSRAIALQVQHQTERARAEGRYHRELAAAEARRAELLQQTSATLERLSAIGQEITAHLDAGVVFQTLDRHVHALLPAATFAVYLRDADGAQLVRAFCIEEGRALPAEAIALSDRSANSVRCLREGRELLIDDAADGRHGLVTPGTLANPSALYVPLRIGERALGVMTVQARQPRAYGDRERLIFRTLCAYGAIALDNADAYRRLQDAQAQLVSQEKLAALGALMAGVAHELNTPIGNSLLIASTMQQKTDALEAALTSASLRRSDLIAFIADARAGAELVMRGLTSAAELVNSFKQVAVDRTTEQRRVFNLQQVAREIIATMMNRVRAARHELAFEIPPTILLDSYPGPFGQVVTNLINNALLHAFQDGQGGQMWLAAHAGGDGRVRITFRDNGNGIAKEHISRIFDPFFTTKLGQGGSGLGLSISYNIVTSLLGGQISVASDQDGTVFTLHLPLVAPQHDPARPASIY